MFDLCQLPARRQVWVALSDLFLDTDTSQTRAWRAQELADSPFSIQEIEVILMDEVYPVCRSNLASIAGVWTGFDPDWLEGKINARFRSPLRVFHAAVNLGRMTMPRSSEWRETKALVAQLRAQSAVSSES